MGLEYIDSMNRMPEDSCGYDIIIISSNSCHEAEYWQQRLSSTRGLVSNRSCSIYSIYEDWNSENGAGNLLGTLYAWKKASLAAFEQEGVSLIDDLKWGKSIAIYHSAGLGARLAPLPASECNSKSAVKLPCLLSSNKDTFPMTILEAVIFQTGPFAPTRQGRLSVFWGDQIFIPSRYDSLSTHHIEMMAKKMKVTKEIENYGLLLPGESGDALLREKMKLPAILENLPPDAAGERHAYTSMGSFSISSDLLAALLIEYEKELADRNVRLCTDADLWQPLTSTMEEYVASGRDPEKWHRTSQFWEHFQKKSANLRKLGCVDIGESYWWDFGNIKCYLENLLKILEDSGEGELMRRFFQVSSTPLEVKNSEVASCEVSDSLIVGSSIDRGSIKNSIVINSSLKDAFLDHCIVFESVVTGRAQGARSIFYRILEEGDLILEPCHASAGIFVPPATRFRMKIPITGNGKENWRKQILDNPHSLFDVWHIMKGVDRKTEEAYFNEIREGLLSKMKTGSPGAP
jgi:hypothetical protein